MMSPKLSGSSNISYRPRYSFIFAVLFIVVAISAACNQQAEQKNGTGVKTSVATPEPTQTDDDDDDDDKIFREEDAERPIIISGGSLNLLFDSSEYLPVAASSPEAKQFKSDSHRIKTINVFKEDADENDNNPELLCPEIQDACADGNCRIMVTYKKNGDHATIKIDSVWTAAAKYVQIEFSTLKLLRRLTKHSSSGARIEKVEYHTSSGATTGLTPCAGAKRHTTIEINTCTANPTACPAP